MEIKLTSVLFYFRKRLLTTIMRTLIFFFCLTALGFAPNNAISQNSKVTITSNKTLSIDEVFDLIMKQTDYKFIYQEGIFDNYPEISVKQGVISANALLKKSLVTEDFDLIVSENNNILIKKRSLLASLFQQKVTGNVTDATGVPILGVNIIVKGKRTGTGTDIDGNYELVVPDQNNILVFSFLGYKTQEVVVGNKKNIDVILIEDANVLEEVILTGYEKRSVEQSTGSATTVKGEELEKRGRSNLINALEGKIAGLGITSDPDNEGGKKIDIRGISTLNGNSAPLLVIDGFPVTTDISQVNPYDIETVTVLKDAGAASIYGAQAANGVIVITTKRGKKGTLSINYTQNSTYTLKPDVDYRLNRLSSSDLVDAQIIGAQNQASYAYHTYEWTLANNHFYDSPDARTAVFNAMAAMNEGSLTQAQVDARINPLRSRDNLSQISDYFTQSPIEHQHNLSISGGGDNNVFRATLNYTSSKSSFVGDKSERTIFDFQNSTDISKKVKLEINGNLTFSNNKSIPYNREIVLNQISSYELFADENGNPLPVTVGTVGEFGAIASGGLYGGKDPIEIQRLVDLGLYDETYYPLNELKSYTQESYGLNARIQAMLHADLAKGLRGTFGFKYESGSNRNTRIATEESYEIRSLVNNLSPVDYNGDNTTLNIPRGGRIIETRGDSNAYTGRVQLDYEVSFGKHNIRALAGSEVRHMFNSSITTDRFGYDEFSLNTLPVDKYRIGSASNSTVDNINHPIGILSGGINFNDRITESTNRFFSAYGNMSYDFDRKYVLTGSIRLDQSNLFGTDPKYRYKPFWSVGGKWNIDNEDFFDVNFISNLAIRGSYGVNGNIANLYGPFDIASYALSSRAGGVEGLEITTPAISNLRWERTSTKNVGLDIAMFNNNVKLGVDYYKKNTTDIFAFGKNDPTNGSNYVLKNDASITNDGIEVSLGTTNVRTNNFIWTSNIVLRHNKNKVKEVFVNEQYPVFLAQRPQNLEGNPANSFYVFDWAGLDENGNARIKTNSGEIKTVEGYFSPYTDVVKEDLVYAGTLSPTFTGSFSNNITYKNLSLSFMFVTNQGHKLLKDSYNGDQIYSRPQNVNSNAQYAWQQPGDEAFTDVPAISKSSSDLYTSTFSKYSTKNVVDAGFIRLREVILGYSLPTDLTKTLGIKSANINLRGNNLWLIANNDEGIDPEAHGIGARYFPVRPAFSLGINVSF